MNSEIYERLKTLTEYAGFKLKDSSVIKSEISAYTEGLSVIYDRIMLCMQEAYSALARDYGLSIMLDEYKIKGASSIEEAEKMIWDRQKELFGNFSMSLFSQAFEKACGEEAGFETENGVLTIKNTKVTADGVALLGQFLKGWVAPFILPIADGDGLSWAVIDNNSWNFICWDNADCPFSVLDTLKEQ